MLGKIDFPHRVPREWALRNGRRGRPLGVCRRCRCRRQSPSVPEVLAGPCRRRRFEIDGRSTAVSHHFSL